MAMEHRTCLRSLEDEVRRFMELAGLSTRQVLGRIDVPDEVLKGWEANDARKKDVPLPLEHEMRSFMRLMSRSFQEILGRFQDPKNLLGAWKWFDKETKRRWDEMNERAMKCESGNPLGHDPLGGKDTTFGPLNKLYPDCRE